MVLAGGACIGFAPIGLRLGLSDLGPQAIAFWRYTLAIPVLFLLVLIVQKRRPSRPNKYVIWAGIFFACDVALWHWGLELTTVARAAFLINLGNIGVGLAAWLILKEKPTRIWFGAVCLAIAGAAALSLGGEAVGQGDLRGDLLSLSAAVLVSGYVVFAKLARGSLNGLETLFWLSCAEACVAALITAVSGEAFFPDMISGFKVPLFLALVVHVLGQGLIITGLGRTSAAIAGLMVLIQPVVSSGVAWMLFKEPLTALQIGGATLILIAIWLAQQKSAKPLAS